MFCFFKYFINCLGIAVNACLKSRTNAITKCCVFSLEILCKPFTGASFYCCLFMGLSAFSFFAVSEKHGLSGLGQVNWLPIKEYAFICLEKLLSAFRSWLWVIINLHSELLSNQFCSISLNRENSLVNAKIHPAASISCHIINKYVDPILLTTMHPHCLHIACTMFDR